MSATSGIVQAATTSAHAQVTASDDTLVLLAVLVAIGIGALFTVWKIGVIQSTGPGREPPVEKTNCPSCGARTPVTDVSCEYCGEPLSGGD